MLGSVPLEDKRPALIVGVDIQMVGCWFVSLFVCLFVDWLVGIID